ncbi:acyl-CoA dehydrogenase family protein [Streptomyces iconiensis]|uniref:Acyl-CoA dehydrogenase family protein n=1 Tax=Streptomyces iconiensis TaxID=1384038 RepID=A0ABT7A9T7_9ACTN|nr:acyl-CoA dehydrogenase family protein [Streptomyces iconiensis]MDJ1138096.1 acyl-CoA dehydrogenase family protein [Streptomyces iconiensis]
MNTVERHPRLHPTPEQTALRALVRKALAGGDTGQDRAQARLAREIGAYGLALPERHGGADCTLAEVAVVAGELGRTLTPSPYLGTQLAARALLHAGDEAACARLLPGVAEGRPATLAWAESGSWAPESVTLRARTEGDPHADGAWRLTGVKEHVLDTAAWATPAGGTGGGVGPGGPGSDGADSGPRLGGPDSGGPDSGGAGREGAVLLVLARTDSGLALFEALAAPRAGLPAPMDLSRPLVRLTFEGTPARLVGAAGEGGRVLARTRDDACALLAAEQVGGAERCLELTLEHARVRVQFGRPIGSFQAVKHRLADMYVRLESARSAALAAAGDPERYGALAKAVCSEAYAWIAGETIQLHGGTGFTWEHPAHRYFKRAHGSAQLFGAPAGHRERMLRERLRETLGERPHETLGGSLRAGHGGPLPTHREEHSEPASARA